MEKLNKYLIYKIAEYVGYFEEGKINVLSKKINNEIPLTVKYKNFTITKSCKVHSKSYTRLKHYIYTLKDVDIPKKIKYMMKIMFNEIIEVYNKVKPNYRKNFLHFGYCSIQFLKILNEESHICNFFNLKSYQTICKHNIIFEKICKEKKWNEWIPTEDYYDDNVISVSITRSGDLFTHRYFTITLPSITNENNT